MSEIQGKVGSASRLRRARSLALMAIVAALLMLVSLLAACTGNDDSGTSHETLATMEARRSAVPTSPPSTGSPEASPGGESSPVPLPEGNAENGKALATSLGCVACHSTDGSKLTGPSWKGLYGHEVKLADGSTTTADETYIHTAIMDPNKQVVDGFSPIMPNFSAQLDDQKVADLIAYIKSLQ